MNNLLIVFTLSDASTSNAYFKELLNNNNPINIRLENNWQFLSFNFDKIVLNDVFFTPDIILVNDIIQVDFQNLRNLINNIDKIYVIYHGDPESKKFSKDYGRHNHDSLLALIKQTNKIKNYYYKYDHHNYSGTTIFQLENLVKSRNNFDNYKEVINKIFDNGNWIVPDETIAQDTLETKLNLLHKCLITEDLSNLNWDWLKGDEKTKFDVIRNMKNVCISDQIYINALSEFRDELLKDFS